MIPRGFRVLGTYLKISASEKICDTLRYRARMIFFGRVSGKWVKSVRFLVVKTVDLVRVQITLVSCTSTSAFGAHVKISKTHKHPHIARDQSDYYFWLFIPEISGYRVALGPKKRAFFSFSLSVGGWVSPDVEKRLGDLKA